MWRLSLLLSLALVACGEDTPATDAGGDDASGPIVDAAAPDAGPPPDAAPCPATMALVGTTCIDLYEAPNRVDALPLVMYSFDEAAAWCAQRGKRLCWEDEWLEACAGPDGWAYPYGDTHVPGQCNDDKVWRVYDQNLLNGWPSSASAPDVESVGELLDRARATGAAGAAAADHVESLYQGEAPADSPACAGAYGVYDLVGNAEEWTRRRTSVDPNFEGNLKGRYWAESRTCQSNVTTHADPFRFYEIGFRCCRDPS